MPNLEEILLKDMKDNTLETINDLISSLNYINLKKINIGYYNLEKILKTLLEAHNEIYIPLNDNIMYIYILNINSINEK